MHKVRVSIHLTHTNVLANLKGNALHTDAVATVLVQITLKLYANTLQLSR
jgi:hypothetical protein